MHGNEKVIEKTGYLLKKELFLFRIIILEKADELRNYSARYWFHSAFFRIKDKEKH